MALLRMVLGVLVWAAHFGAIYASTSVACARGFDAAVPWAVGAATLAAAGAAGAIVVTHWSPEFTRWLVAAVAAVALLAIVWEGLVVLVVPPCG
jgi:hypothetical protein